MTPEQQQHAMLAKAAKLRFRRFIFHVATVGYVIGLTVGCLLTIWLGECE